MYGCEWYKFLIENDIPTISTTIRKVESWDHFVDLNNQHRDLFPCFIRFCNASPKDCRMCQDKNQSVSSDIFSGRDTCIFDKPSESIITQFKSSSRTWFMMDANNVHKCHVMYREIVSIDYELRCFWYNQKLIAVSGPNQYVNEQIQTEIKNSVDNFFEIYGDKFKRHSMGNMVIDLCYNDGFPFVIELNEFNSSGWELFNVEERQFALSEFNTECVFKFYEEFEW
jgi:hypothetical protein